MKNFLFLFLSFALIFSSCDKKKTNEIDKGKLDPDAMILIKESKSAKPRAKTNYPTALEIVEQAVNIKWQSHYFGNDYYETPKEIARTFGDFQKDFNIPALKMLGVDVIDSDGAYYRDLTYAFSVYITDGNNDSIAYIPDETIERARIAIEAAYNNKNYDEVYRLFDEAFTFLPLPVE